MTRYVYQWPAALKVTGSGWVPQHRIGSTRSLLSGAVYQTETHRPRILATVSGVAGPPHMPDLNIFLARMRGGHNLVQLTDWEAYRNGGVVSTYQAATVNWADASGGEWSWDDTGTLRPWVGASPVVAANAAADAATISVSGLWPSLPAFTRGAEISIGGWRYRVTADVTADADGLASISIAPRLVLDAAEDDAVTYEASGLFVLAAPPTGLERDQNGVSNWQMQFLQVFADELGEVPVHEDA
ncbi:MAG: hypothetical protein P1U65_07540 [Minwuia sp.]|nr:hypothetical protein [Minwuia sp.]